MCIVIDTNTFAPVFVSSSQKHNDFKPVLEWIINGKGKIVYGGSKYKKELQNANKYLRFFAELSRLSKVIVVDCSQVDKIQNDVESMLTSSCVVLIYIYRYK